MKNFIVEAKILMVEVDKEWRKKDIENYLIRRLEGTDTLISLRTAKISQARAEKILLKQIKKG